MYTYKCELLRMIDTDTIIVNIDLGFSIKKKETLRLDGLDAPEISTPEGKSTYYKLSEKVDKFIVDNKYKSMFTVQIIKYDKYGRSLAVLIDPEGNNINNWLLENGYAKPYNGKGPR